MYFDNCYTPDEVKVQYRTLAKKMHPDVGGSKVDFQSLQSEYEQANKRIAGNEHTNHMPNLFDQSGSYEYYRKPVRYEGIYYNHYYKFVQDFGADILIDLDHVKLIFTKAKTLR